MEQRSLFKRGLNLKGGFMAEPPPFVRGLERLEGFVGRNNQDEPHCFLHIEMITFCQEKFKEKKSLQILFNIDFFSICVNIETVTFQVFLLKKSEGFCCFDPFWLSNFLQPFYIGSEMFKEI